MFIPLSDRQRHFFALSKVALVLFDAIWLCFCTLLWFLQFLTTFFRPCQRAILRVHN